jgi:hypothetical protein
MDPVDVDALIEQAKKNSGGAEAARALPVPKASSTEVTKEAAEVDDILGRVQDALETEEIEEEIRKEAGLERRRDVTMAKLLAAVDVFSGVSQ